eukprot:1155635-Pelagomonas_calceolata.AAC.13
MLAAQEAMQTALAQATAGSARVMAGGAAAGEMPAGLNGLLQVCGCMIWMWACVSGGFKKKGPCWWPQAVWVVGEALAGLIGSLLRLLLHVCVCVRVYARVCACVCACARVCTRSSERCALCSKGLCVLSMVKLEQHGSVHTLLPSRGPSLVLTSLAT